MLMLLFSSSSTSVGLTSFAASSLLIGFSGLRTDRFATDNLLGHVTDWRQSLRSYVDARFRSDAADKIFDVVAHNYDRWYDKTGRFVAETRDDHEVKGEPESQTSREIADELLADCRIAAPTIRMAKFHSACERRRRRHSGVTYLYYFNDSDVAFDLLTYVFGAPLCPGIDPFHSGPYSDADRQITIDVVKRWANFIHSGQVSV